MTILKATFLTLFLFLFISVVEYCILKLPYNENTIRVLVVLSDLIPRMMALIGIGLILRMTSTKNVLRRKDFEKPDLVIMLLVFVMGILLHIMNITFSHWHKIFNFYVNNKIEIEIRNTKNVSITFVGTAISAVLLTPLIEEIVFRGWIFRKMKNTHSLFVALIVSSLLFSLIHIANPRNIIPAFIFGIFSALILHYSGKLQYSLLLHVIVNAIWVVLRFIKYPYERLINWTIYHHIALALPVISILLLILCIRYLDKLIPKYQRT